MGLNESAERSTRLIDLDGAPAPTPQGVNDGSATCTKEERSGGGIAEELFNRLEQPAFALFPRLAELKRSLLGRPGVQAALLSGSGSTLLALVEDAAAGAALAEALAREGLRAVASRTQSSAPK